MSESEQPGVEVRRIRRMLRAMEKMAREASLTGSLSQGARSSAQQYNMWLGHLERGGAVPVGLFPPLAEEASFDEVGVAAAFLRSYLEEDELPEPPEPPHAPGRHRHGPQGSHNVFIGMGGLRQLEELKDLGRTIREHFPEWLREQVAADPEARPAPPPGTPAPPPPPPPGSGPRLSEVESRLAEVGAKLQAVAEQLRRNSLSDQQRAELAEQLSRLGQEQARLAREHAALREQT